MSILPILDRLDNRPTQPRQSLTAHWLFENGMVNYRQEVSLNQRIQSSATECGIEGERLHRFQIAGALAAADRKAGCRTLSPIRCQNRQWQIQKLGRPERKELY